MGKKLGQPFAINLLFKKWRLSYYLRRISFQCPSLCSPLLYQGVNGVLQGAVRPYSACERESKQTISVSVLGAFPVLLLKRVGWEWWMRAHKKSSSTSTPRPGLTGPKLWIIWPQRTNRTGLPCHILLGKGEGASEVYPPPLLEYIWLGGGGWMREGAARPELRLSLILPPLWP